MYAVTHQILNLNCVLSQMAINGTCEATPTRPQNSYPISARGLEGFNTFFIRSGSSGSQDLKSEGLGKPEVTDLRVPESARCSFFQCRSLFLLRKKYQNDHPRPGAPRAAEARCRRRGAEAGRGAPVLERLQVPGGGGQRRIRTSDIALLAQIERELYEVEEQLVSKKIAERLLVGNPRRLGAG